MKKTWVLFVLAAPVLILILCGFVWKTVIQPKNTRLAFYEIVTTSHYQGQTPDIETKLLSWIDSLEDLNLNHLKLCERVKFHNKTNSIRRRLAALSRTSILDLDPNADPIRPVTSLQSMARTYFEETPTFETLVVVAESEYTNVTSETQRFQQELIEGGFAGTLDELAMQPKNFSADPEVVKALYDRHIARGATLLATRFFQYDIPKGHAIISLQGHRWGAPARYNKNDNSMTAYFDSEKYDTTIIPFISVHEIYPGHHLSLNTGLSNPLCPSDNTASYSWLEEGWATYAEFLADEEGVFEKPEHKLAWLDYRLIRAMRLILDIERAQNFAGEEALKAIWQSRMPTRLHARFDTEFYRLEKSRHQHLKYIFGYKAITNAKAKLQNELGTEFNEKIFHDAILRLQHQEVHFLYETVKLAMELSAAEGKDTPSPKIR